MALKTLQFYGAALSPYNWSVLGYRPSHNWRKVYPLAQGIIPYRSGVSTRDSGVVGEGLWPSKGSNVMAMHVIKEHFEGHRPSHPRRKAYPLAQEIFPN
jgi:hypothetical protein